MSETLKDAAYYIANPDAIAGLSDDQIEALAYPTDAPKSDTNSAAPLDSVATEQVDADTKPAVSQAVEAEADILTKDGKHVIPHKVLEATREQVRAEAEARAAAEARVTELQAQLDAAKSGVQVADVEQTMSPEELAVMREDFPAMAAMYDKLQAQLANLQSVAAQSQAAQQAAAQQEVAKTVQETIDANPKLAYLQASDPDAWAKAVAIDDQLRGNPDFANLPLADRFVKAATVYESLYGAISIPSAKTLPADKPSAPAKPSVPISMSAIPGGTPPAVDEAAALGSMGGTQATSYFSGMTIEQIEQRLNML